MSKQQPLTLARYIAFPLGIVYIRSVSVVATRPFCVFKFCENLIVRRVSITLFFSYVRHHTMPVQMYQKFWCCGCGGALFSPQISCQYPSVIPHFPSTCREGRRHPPRAHCRRPSPLRAMRPYARRDSIPPHSPRGSTLPAWHQTPPGEAYGASPPITRHDEAQAEQGICHMAFAGNPPSHFIRRTVHGIVS